MDVPVEGKGLLEPLKAEMKDFKKPDLVDRLLLRTDMDKILALTSLQMAAGNFRYDQSVLDLVIGTEAQMFREACDGWNIEQEKWLTAFIIAFIEQRFASHKDTWELLVEKSREWLNNEALIEEAKKIINRVIIVS